MIVAVSILIGAISLVILLSAVQAQAQAKPPVIFRMDDVQDYYANHGQKIAMDLFLTKKIPLTIGIIGSAIGNDTLIADTVRQGIKTGLLEPALHGFRHVDYTELTPSNQSSSITAGNLVIKKLFGVHPFIFIPPFNTYNNNTIGAMQSHDMNIISSVPSVEAQHKVQGRDVIYNAADKNASQVKPAHVSASEDFRIITPQGITTKTNEQIMTEIADNVKKYGYSVLVLHPQDFVYTNPKNGTIIRNEVDPARISQLQALTSLVQSNYTPLTMDQLVNHKSPVVVKKNTSLLYDVTSVKPRVAVLTFDDDWIGQYKYAVPILKKYGFNATFFVTCEGPTQQAPSFVRGKSPDIITWDQLRQIKAAGFDIENHGLTHHSLVNQNMGVLEREIVHSKHCLEQHLPGTKPSVFAPAYAKPEGNKTIDSLIAANYQFARNGYGNGQYNSDRYALPTNSVNSLDKEFSHDTLKIVGAFARVMNESELPILVYHNINNLNNTDSNWSWSTTTPETFDAEMKWLKDNGYQVHSIRDLTYTDKGFAFK